MCHHKLEENAGSSSKAFSAGVHFSLSGYLPASELGAQFVSLGQESPAALFAQLLVVFFFLGYIKGSTARRGRMGEQYAAAASTWQRRWVYCVSEHFCVTIMWHVTDTSVREKNMYMCSQVFLLWSAHHSVLVLNDAASGSQKYSHSITDRNTLNEAVIRTRRCSLRLLGSMKRLRKGQMHCEFDTCETVD